MASLTSAVGFGPADYVLLGLMLAGSMGIGIFLAVTGKKEQTKTEYLLGGRSMTAIPVCLSLFATFQSAISLMGIPTEVYTYGTMCVYSFIGLVLAYPLAMVTAIPLMYPLGLTSVYEYLALRYQSRSVQTLGAVVGVFGSVSYMTVALLSPALALETAVGIPLWMSIALVGTVGTVYTTLGGMKSVVWTDVFQSGIMFTGIFTVLIKGTMDAGGMTEVWQLAKDNGRVVFDDTSLDPRVRHTVLNQIFGFLFYWLAVHFSQSSVQRIISTKTIQEANKVYIFTTPVVIIYDIALTITGLVILAYFFTVGCDPLAAGYIQNKNQLVPYFVLDTLSFLPGLSGLYISTIFSGALSTLSSGINSLSANVVQDFLSRPLRNKPESVVTTITKVLVCFFGVAIIGLAYLAKEFQGPITQITFTVQSASSGPVLGLFLLSGLFPQANHVGAIVGLLSGLVIGSWQAIGSMMVGYSTPSLPLGPTHHCFVENTTQITTPAWPLIVNDTGLHNISSWGASTTSSYDYSSTSTMTRLGLQDRNFSFFDFSYTLNPVIGAVATIVVGLATSIIIKPALSEVRSPEAKYLFPFCRRFWYSDRDVLSTEMQPTTDKDIEIL